MVFEGVLGQWLQGCSLMQLPIVSNGFHLGSKWWRAPWLVHLHSFQTCSRQWKSHRQKWLGSSTLKSDLHSKFLHSLYDQCSNLATGVVLFPGLQRARDFCVLDMILFRDRFFKILVQSSYARTLWLRHVKLYKWATHSDVVKLEKKAAAGRAILFCRCFIFFYTKVERAFLPLLPFPRGKTDEG